MAEAAGLLGRGSEGLAAQAFAKGQEFGRNGRLDLFREELKRLMSYSWQPYIPQAELGIGLKGRRLELPRGVNEGAIEEQIRKLVAGYASSRGSSIETQKTIVGAYKTALLELYDGARGKMGKLNEEMRTAFERIKGEVARERSGISAADLAEEATRRLNQDLYDRNLPAHGENLFEYRATSGRWDGKKYVGGYYERMEKKAIAVVGQLNDIEKALANPIRATEVLGKMAKKLGIKGAAATALATAVAGYLIYQTLKPEEMHVPKKVGKEGMDF